MYIERHLEKQVLEASRYYPAVMVCGQRQVGKSTMLYHIKKPERRYVSLDDAQARRLALEDPALFFEAYGSPLLIDEFQRAPGLLIELKKIVDEKMLRGENCAGLFWLTGSQKFQMMQGVAESLAGRVAVLDMSSLSAAEIEGRSCAPFQPDPASLRERLKSSLHKDIHQIFKDIFMGGMPRLRASSIDRDRFYGDYVTTYLERDIKDLAQVGKLSAFYDFMVYMAARTGQQLKYSEIANDIGISAPTAKAWVSILERSGVIYILRPYFSNLTKRLIKTPKMYFMDTGLVAYLCRWPDAESLAHNIMSGAFFETYVVSEIVKSFFNAGRPADLFYYRDVDKREIDLLIVEGNRIYPLEIKKAKDPNHPARHFDVLTKLGLEVEPGIIICLCDELVPYNRQSWLCPVSAL